jgi:hypothetical protein
MQATAYEGYFDNGRFYASGKEVHIPEQRRVIITILNDIQAVNLENSRKKEILRNLRGSCKDETMVKPSEVPLEHDIPRRYDLI